MASLKKILVIIFINFTLSFNVNSKYKSILWFMSSYIIIYDVVKTKNIEF